MSRLVSFLGLRLLIFHFNFIVNLNYSFSIQVLKEEENYILPK